MIRVTSLEGLLLAKPIQLYSSILGPNYCEPDGFGIFEVDSLERPLSYLVTKIFDPTKQVVLVRCQHSDASKFETKKEASDFLKLFEVEN